MDERQRIFTKNLKDYVNKSGKTQKEICDALKITPSTFSTWTQGKSLPRMGKCQMLADYFGCTLGDLLEDRPKIEPSDSNFVTREEMEIRILFYYLVTHPEMKELIEKMKKLKPEEIEILSRLVDSMVKGDK